MWSGLGRQNAVLTVDEPRPDVVLVDVLEDVGRVNENTQSSADRHSQEDVQLETVDDQSDVPPVIQHLATNK